MLLGVDLKILINISKYILAIYVCLCNKFSFCTITGQVPQEMKPLPSKRMVRIEKKKKKMAALLEISKLNEHDRNKSAQMTNIELAGIEIEPSPKRLRTEVEILSTKKCPVIEQLEEEPAPNADIGYSGKPKVYGEDFLQLKRLLREQTNKMRAEPKFRLREIGEAATLAVNIEERIPLFLSDIQHLLLFSQIGHHAPYIPSRWCHIEKYSKLQNANLLIIENLSSYHFQSHENLFPYLSATFPHKLEIITPGAYKGDIVQDLATVPLTGTQVKKYINEFKSLEEAVIKSPDVYDRIKDLFPLKSDAAKPAADSSLPKGDKFPRTHLLLSGWQMVEENFPLPIKGLMESKYVGYVLTRDTYKEVTLNSPMFGIDCEMCRTSSGDLELTRVSVVDENYKVFYEELVKPYNRIVDYLTQYSGITPRMIKNVTKQLKDVQDDLRKLLPPDAILVGQSLSNDMHALKMMHPYVIDTSVIYNITGERMRKTKLQTLAREFLDERIQEGRGGHCSIEDSMASLKLTKHKLAHDLYYGDAVMANVATHVRHHPDLGHPHFATSMLKHATRLDKTVHLVSSEEITNKYRFYTFKKEQPTKTAKINFMSEKSNQSIIKRMCESTMGHSINIGHLRFSDSQVENESTKIFKQIDDWVRDIHEATAAPGLCIVIFGGQREAGNGCCFITIKRLP